MKKLLVINASARMEQSHSRTLTEVFAGRWKDLHKDAEVSLLDLGSINVPHLSQKWIDASFKPAAERTEKDREILSISNEYIGELRKADIILLGTPMYNWSIPSMLKAYIDQVLRVNETFTVNPSDPSNPYVGLLKNKTLVLLVARGGNGYETGERNEHLNFQTTYLKTVFGMMGIEDVHTVAVNGTSLDKETLKHTVAQAHQEVRSVIDAIGRS